MKNQLTQVNQEVTNQANEYGHGGFLLSQVGLAKMLAIGAFMAGGVELADTNTSSYAKVPTSESINCSFAKPNYNPVLCGLTKQQGANLCSKEAHFPPLSLRASLERGDKYRVAVRLAHILECSPAGTRKMSLTLMGKSKSASSLKPIGNPIIYKTNKGNEIVKPFNLPRCTPSLKGIRVEARVRETWIPAKGWPAPNKGKPVTTYYTKPQKIC